MEVKTKKHGKEIFINSKTVFENVNPLSKEKEDSLFENLMQKGLVYKEDDGVYLYFGIINKIYQSLTNYFRKKAISLEAEEISLPSLLNIKTLEQSDYIKNNSHICNYVVGGDRSDNSYSNVLNPAACQPLYKHLNKSGLDKAYTGQCKVYRTESQGYHELYRLREYTIREVVFVSNEDEVKKFKLKMIELVSEIIKELGLTGKIETASDIFFEDEFNTKAIFQLATESKLEASIKLNNNQSIAACSINMHDYYFS
ncbi:MAG: hypothetical protein FWF46_06295 [Oscillospiraceae bacterium]|nr:hypothetical protein [Oscillospiraceae bacterium]